MNSRRSKGRPNKTLLSRQIIANGALKIIEEVGYEKLTMARIAREIEVAPSALYNHVANKRDLLILVEDEVMAKVDTTLLDAALRGEVEPVEGLYRWAESYREVFARHTPLVEVIAGMPISGAPRAVEMYEKVAAVFGAAGVEDSMVLPRIIMLESFIYGSAFDVHAPADIFEVPEGYEVAIPALRRARAAWADSVSSEDTEVSAPNPFAEDPFRIGLQALLGDLK